MTQTIKELTEETTVILDMIAKGIRLSIHGYDVGRLTADQAFKEIEELVGRITPVEHSVKV